jgi:hypothetical protein
MRNDLLHYYRYHTTQYAIASCATLDFVALIALAQDVRGVDRGTA